MGNGPDIKPPPAKPVKRELALPELIRRRRELNQQRGFSVLQGVDLQTPSGGQAGLQIPGGSRAD